MNWNLPEIKGSRDACKQKVAAAKDEKSAIPKDVKDFIAAEIDSMPADVTGCRITGFSQDANNPSSLTLTRNINLTIVGFKL